MIEENFPIHVFALDPQVEEQNVYDAFNRRLELQLALAIGVAQRRFGLSQRLAMSRQLELEMATIDLNRTAVAFTHGNDTFGWYFRPRVQAPPTESTNIGALVRTLWSTGPTEHYDMKHRKLEPGIRECEALVAMPSFVTQVDFDITTNWEKLHKPGATKRSYEEMIALGSRIHTLRQQLYAVTDQDCYRPGDFSRLASRVEQMEKMLALQTHSVNVPYEYEISGTDLFDTGDAHLRPVLHDFHGLEYVKEGIKEEVHVFLTGKNFHPTLTHVIIGGSESHSTVPGEVEVISRELLQVKIKTLNKELSDKEFVVRVGTPAGLSGPLTIPGKRTSPKKTGFGLSEEPKWLGTLCNICDAAFCRTTRFTLHGQLPDQLVISYEPKYQPLLPSMQRPGVIGWAVVRFTGKDSDGKAVKFLNSKDPSYVDTEPLPIYFEDGKLTIPVRVNHRVPGRGPRFPRYMQDGIEEALSLMPPEHGGKPVELEGKIYAKFDQWPVTEFLTPIKISVKPQPIMYLQETRAKEDETPAAQPKEKDSDSGPALQAPGGTPKSSETPPADADGAATLRRLPPVEDDSPMIGRNRAKTSGQR